MLRVSGDRIEAGKVLSGYKSTEILSKVLLLVLTGREGEVEEVRIGEGSIKIAYAGGRVAFSVGGKVKGYELSEVLSLVRSVFFGRDFPTGNEVIEGTTLPPEIRVADPDEGERVLEPVEAGLLTEILIHLLQNLYGEGYKGMKAKDEKGTAYLDASEKGVYIVVPGKGEDFLTSHNIVRALLLCLGVRCGG